MATVARIAALIREDKADEAMALHLDEGYPLYRRDRDPRHPGRPDRGGGHGPAPGGRRGDVPSSPPAHRRLRGGVDRPGPGPRIRHLLVLHPPRPRGRGVPRPGRQGRLRRQHRRAEPRRVRRPRPPDERDEPRAAPALRRPAAGRAPAPGAQRGARAGQPGQVRLPRQHEPRAPHADERDPRLHRDDPRRAVRGGAARDPGAGVRHPHLRQAAPRPDQQRARSLQDRGRAHGAGPRRVRGRGHREHREALAALPGRDEGAGPRHHRGPRPARSAWATASGSRSA